MKELVSKVLKHPLFAGSAFMVIGSNGANFLNYIYHLIMGRLLSPEKYGELSVLFSLIALIGIIPQSFNLLIVKFISEAQGKKHIKGLIDWFSKRIIVFTICLFILICLFSKVIAKFLNIDNYMLIILSGLVFVFSLQAFLNRSVLQGLLKFKEMITSVILENGVKLISGVIFVYLGFSLFGAMVGLVFAAIFGWIITRNYLKDYQSITEEVKPKNREILTFSLPVLIQSIAYTSLISSDLILVKHFFNPEEAGLYAAVATLGKIIFFATGPVIAVMIPLIAKKKLEKSNYRQIFLLSLAINLAITLAAVSVFYFLPNLTVSSLYGDKYLGAAQYLSLFGVFMICYTISSLFVNYYLMLNRTRVVLLPMAAAIGQVVGIYLFHQNLISVIYVSIAVTFLLIISLIFVYFSNVMRQAFSLWIKLFQNLNQRH